MPSEESRSLDSKWGLIHRFLVEARIWGFLIKHPAWIIVAIVFILVATRYEIPLSGRFYSINFNNVPNITGLWEYRCEAGSERFDHGGFRHGGTVTIEQGMATYGSSVKLDGKRVWISYEKEGNQRKTLPTPDSWDTINGAFVGKSKFQFWYDVKTKKGKLEGFAEASLEESLEKIGQYETASGRFTYMIDKDKYMFGNLYLRKMKSPNDFKYYW